jgi:hypothetical protein
MGAPKRVAALPMIEPHADRPQAITLGADRPMTRERIALDEGDAACCAEYERALVGGRWPHDAPSVSASTSESKKRTVGSRWSLD